jgi:RNA polymerase sigma-70 factor, ECF subfamily
VRSQTSGRNRELANNGVATTQPLEDDALSKLSEQCIRRALAGLDDDERVPIELAYMGGLSYRAVADYLELPEGTVKSRIKRGLQKLKASSDLVRLIAD